MLPDINIQIKYHHWGLYELLLYKQHISVRWPGLVIKDQYFLHKEAVIHLIENIYKTVGKHDFLSFFFFFLYWTELASSSFPADVAPTSLRLRRHHGTQTADFTAAVTVSINKTRRHLISDQLSSSISEWPRALAQHQSSVLTLADRWGHEYTHVFNI